MTLVTPLPGSLHRLSAVIAGLAIVAGLAVSAATDYVALPLFQFVQLADVIVVGKIVDAEAATVQVEQVLKGRAGASIHLVDFVDGSLPPDQQRPLAKGTRELMFLKKAEQGFAPIQTQFGRWPFIDGKLQAPRQISQHGVPDFSKTIAQLVLLQTNAAKGGASAAEAYVTAIESADYHVRLWGAFSGYQSVDQPPARLVDAYLRLWAAGEPEFRNLAAEAVIKWRVSSAAPAFAAGLDRDKDLPTRTAAARGLGGTGDLKFLPALREAASSDPSPLMRAAAYEGMTYLLGGKSIAELSNGNKDESVLVRRAVAIHAFNLAQRDRDPGVQASVRRFLEGLMEDASPDVRGTADSLLKQLPQ